MISELFDGVDNRDRISLSVLRGRIGYRYEEMRLRIENEIEDIEFRLKRGSDLGQFDQFWDDDTLFNCRYSRSKWLAFDQIVPLDVYSHALKGNKNIIHISFGFVTSDFDVKQFLCDLPWVTSISTYSSATIRRDLLFIQSTNNDLKKFAKEIKLVPPSTYNFSDAGFYDVLSVGLRGNARVLISFVPPTSSKSLILRVKHSGEEDGPLAVTLGSNKIQLNPSTQSPVTIDDITLYPIDVSGSSESDHLSFEPEVRNDIFIRFIGPDEYHYHHHILHDIELLDEAGLEYMPHSASLSNPSH